MCDQSMGATATTSWLSWRVSTNGSTPIPSQASLSAGSTSGPTLETAGAELRCCGSMGSPANRPINI